MKPQNVHTQVDGQLNEQLPLHFVKLIGPLDSLGETYMLVPRMEKKQLIKDWCAQSLSMAVRFGTPLV